MKSGEQIRRVFVCAGLGLALTAMPAFAQHRNDARPSGPPPSRPEPPRNESRSAPPRNESRQPANELRPRDNELRHPANESRPEFSAPRDYRPYQPPREGHHSGQWLNQHRDMTVEQQRRVLENDPQFRRLSPQSQQRLEQRLQRFDSLPPERQQMILRRMETWEHLTPQQKQDFRGLRAQFNGLPPDRRMAVRNAIESLRAMPPGAREREIQSGRFSQFSPQERQILNDAARLPLAPAENESAQPTQPQNNPSQRYIPRPPH